MPKATVVAGAGEEAEGVVGFERHGEEMTKPEWRMANVASWEGWMRFVSRLEACGLLDIRSGATGSSDMEATGPFQAAHHRSR
jgi:hypothetical protein